MKINGSWLDLATLSNVLWSIQRDHDLERIPLADRVAIMSSSPRDRWAQHKEAMAKRGVLTIS